MSEIVLFDSITKHFGDVVALKDVTLSIQAGEFLSLLGPSGCGKTTLLRTCAGLETPTAGRVYLEGRDVTDVPPYRRPVNMVFQRWALFPHKTVSENIAFGLVIRKASRAEVTRQVRSMLELVRMEGYDDRYPRQLSGGQMQRVALARALVLRPKVLLLDEPLGSLDLKLRKEMQIELIDIHRRMGTTFVYVTHDQEEALTMSDRIVIMNEGVIVQDGSPADIYQKPASVFAAQFIGETILFEGCVETQDGRYSTVLTADCTLLCPPAAGVRNGQKVCVSVRPERMRIAAAPDPSAENHLAGQVTNTIFKGPVVHYQVLLTSGRMVTIYQNLEQNIPLYAAGSSVHLSWSSANCILLPT